MPWKEWSKEDEQFLRDHYKKDLSAPEIGKYVKRSPNAVRNKAFQIGLSDTRPTFDLEEATRLSKLGLTGEQIGKKMSRSRDTVLGHLRKAGYPPKTIYGYMKGRAGEKLFECYCRSRGIPFKRVNAEGIDYISSDSEINVKYGANIHVRKDSLEKISPKFAVWFFTDDLRLYIFELTRVEELIDEIFEPWRRP